MILESLHSKKKEKKRKEKDRVPPDAAPPGRSGWFVWWRFSFLGRKLPHKRSHAAAPTSLPQQPVQLGR